jgi:hypothetical protein
MKDVSKWFDFKLSIRPELIESVYFFDKNQNRFTVTMISKDLHISKTHNDSKCAEFAMQEFLKFIEE